jgi:cysteine synthase A
MRAYGAEIELVDGDISDAKDRADELESRDGHVQLRQFDNPANPEAHYRTTGPEIVEQLGGREPDAFVAGVGTGGTITGVSEYFEEEEGVDLHSVAVEPADSPVLSGGDAGSHSIQGIGAGFIPEILRTELVDEVRTVDHEKAVQTTRKLAREEGVLTGVSAGAALAAAAEVARERPDDLVVVVLPDTGERYLSTDLFAADRVRHWEREEPAPTPSDD